MTIALSVAAGAGGLLLALLGLFRRARCGGIWFTVTGVGVAGWSVCAAIYEAGNLTWRIDSAWLAFVSMSSVGSYVLIYGAAHPWWRLPRWLLGIMIAEPVVFLALGQLAPRRVWERLVERLDANGNWDYHALWVVHTFYCIAFILMMIVAALLFAEHARGRLRWYFLATAGTAALGLTIQMAGSGGQHFLALLELALIGLSVRTSLGEHADAAALARQHSFRLGGLGTQERDPVTGVLSRWSLDRLLQTEVVRAAKRKDRLCLLVVDIDGFKIVNDEHGHLVGDQLLATIAQRVEVVLGPDGHLGRFGGDEFLVVLPGLDLEEAHFVAEGVVRAVHRSVRAGGGIVTPSVSVGVGCYEGGTARKLIAAADAQMYRVKRAGGNAAGSLLNALEDVVADHIADPDLLGEDGPA